MNTMSKLQNRPVQNQKIRAWIDHCVAKGIPRAAIAVALMAFQMSESLLKCAEALPFSRKRQPDRESLARWHSYYERPAAIWQDIVAFFLAQRDAAVTSPVDEMMLDLFQCSPDLNPKHMLAMVKRIFWWDETDWDALFEKLINSLDHQDIPGEISIEITASEMNALFFVQNVYPGCRALR